MKIYIKSAVSVDKLKQQFNLGISDDEFAKIYNLDPTADYDTGKPSKYGVWLFNQYKKGNLTPEIYSDVYDGLTIFSKSPSKFTYQDLGRYKTAEEFLEDTERVSNTPLTSKEKARQLKKDAHRAGDADKKLLATDGSWELWQPLTYAGSISLARQGGAKADWCTAYEGTDRSWRTYTKTSPLYVFINTANPKEKYQVWFGEGRRNDVYNDEIECNDFNNDGIGIKGFYALISKHPEFNKIFKLKLADGDMCINKDELVFYYGDNPTVTIPEGVKAICGQAFIRCNSIEEVIIPQNVREICTSAFRYCKNLSKVVIKGENTRIYDLAFGECENLREVTIPKSVYNRTDLDMVFYKCRKNIHFNLM